MRIFPKIIEGDWALYRGAPVKPIRLVLAGEWRFFTHIARVRAIEWLCFRIVIRVTGKPVRVRK